jgi:hypothetical protein
MGERYKVEAKRTVFQLPRLRGNEIEITDLTPDG